jgi:hypothetical protein
MKPWLRYLLVGIGGLVLGIVVAKYTLPPRVEIRTETKVEVQEKLVYRDKIVKEQGPVRVTTKTVTVPGPAGPTVTVEKIVEKDRVVTVTVKEGAATIDTKEESKSSKIIDSRPWLALEAMGAIAPATGRWAGSGGAQVRALGPLWVGAGVVVADTLYVGPSIRWEF